MKKRPIFYLLCIWAIAISLRLYKLGAQALFFDEAHSWLTSQYPLSDLIWVLRFDNQVPFYYFLLKIYLSIVPHTELGLRSFSVIFSFLSLGLLIWITWRLWGVKASLFAGWLMAISSFEIYYAQETRTYTLLSFLWLSSLALLLTAISGKPKLLILWAINLVLMAYIQATGLILAAVHSAIIGFIWIYGIYRAKKYPALTDMQQNPSEISLSQVAEGLARNSKWVLISGMIIALGILPIVLTLLLTETWRARGGGVWVPRLQDIPILFNLATVGLTAGRQAFLDQNHLVLPILKNIPTWVWFLFGMVTGGLAVKGSIWAWKANAQKRFIVSIILILVIIPPIVVWLLGRSMNINTWAYKSFLGIVLLLYMLSGIGFSRLRQRWLRSSITLFTFVIALLSLLPYFTVWQKADSRAAFAGLPQEYHTGYVLLEKSYLSPLVYFYTGIDANIIGVLGNPDGEKIFSDIQFGT